MDRSNVGDLLVYDHGTRVQRIPLQQRPRPQPRLSSHQFKLANILGLLNHQVVNGPQVASPEVMPTEYKLHEWPIGFGATARMQPN